MRSNIFLLFILLSVLGYGQQNRTLVKTIDYATLTVKGLPFSGFIEKSFHAKIKTFDSSDIQGAKGVCFIKFQIDSNGKIYNRDFTTGTKQILLNFLFDTLDEAQKSWDTNKSKEIPFSNEFFVLPVYYEFPADNDTLASPINSLELSRFFSDSSTIAQIAFLPSVYLHSGYY